MTTALPHGDQFGLALNHPKTPLCRHLTGPLPDNVAADLAAALHMHEGALLAAIDDNQPVCHVMWELQVFPIQSIFETSLQLFFAEGWASVCISLQASPPETGIPSGIGYNALAPHMRGRGLRWTTQSPSRG